MTTLRREQIERWRNELIACTEGGWEFAPTKLGCVELVAICDAALIGLAVTPRPLAEIEGEAFVYCKGSITDFWAKVARYQNGKWRTGVLAYEWPPETLAIPVASLPKPEDV